MRLPTHATLRRDLGAFSEAVGWPLTAQQLAAMATERPILSTCVTAVASSMPKASCPTLLRYAIALRNAMSLPFHCVTCGG